MGGLIWPFLLFLGWESVRIDPGNAAFTPLAFDRYPVTHSMLAALASGGIFWWRPCFILAIYLESVIISPFF